MKRVILVLLGFACLLLTTLVFAEEPAGTGGGTAADIGAIATKVTTQFEAIAKFITGLAYIAGMAFVVGALVKFKAHKDNPTQIPLGTPIVLLFVGAALIFSPSVFLAGGGSMGLTEKAGATGTATF